MTVDAPDPKLARGDTAPRFESVARALERAASAHGEVGCAVSAYLEGRKVVDLCWGIADGEAWKQDTPVVIASATKGLVALCAQILYDRGLLDVDAPVARFWPEYGANGKQSTLVKHVLNHTAGVLTFPNYWELVGGDGLADWELMTTNLAVAPPSWEPGTRCMYHGVTFGYLAGELIRRIDGRTVGRFLADEVATPLGLDMFIGAPPSVLPRVASTLGLKLQPEDISDEQRRYWEDTRRQLTDAREAVRAGDVLSDRALPWSAMFRHPDLEVDLANTEIVAMWNSPRIRMAEIPSGNGITTARDLARMYAALACGGSLDGARLCSPESIARFSSAEDDWADPQPPPFFLGYHPLAPIGLPIAGASASAFGHAGGGGHLGFCDPQNRLSFAFVKNQVLADSQTALDVAASVYECL